jgi:hypothetical protein
MPQAGWLMEVEPGVYEEWSHGEVMEYALTYPDNFPYTPQMLHRMFVHQERDYISATMLSSCPREMALRNLIDYYVPPDYAYGADRGTGMHEFMEGLEDVYAASDEPHEEGAIIERTLEVGLELPDGRVILLRSTPDKVLPKERLLIDYKSLEEVQVRPKSSWIPQMSVYRWMLHQRGIEVDRCLIQQLSMKKPGRMAVELWPLEKTERYLYDRVPRFAGIFDGSFDVDRLLPPQLDFKLDSDTAWKCQSRGGKPAWCPVQEQCFALAGKGI